LIGRNGYEDSIQDLLGIGVGPFNLSLAALLEPVPEVDAVFLERKPCFDWHPGLLMEETTLQVPFLADLVTMADPTSPHSFLNYLNVRGRLYKFYFLERFHVPRREYNHYCRWVSERLENCRFGQEVEEIRWIDQVTDSYFEVRARDTSSGEERTYRARHLALGVGSAPHVPDCFEGLLGEDVFHSAEFLSCKEHCEKADSITVLGSGQSAAEVFYELLKDQEEYGYRLDWFTRSKGFFPMEYSKLGLEHFSPEYIRYFHGLPQKQRDEILPKQDLLYKGIDTETSAKIYDLLYERSVGNENPDVRLLALTEVGGVERVEKPEGTRYRLLCRQVEEDQFFVHETECAVLATGYEYSVPGFLGGVQDLIRWDGADRYVVDLDYRLELTQNIPNGIFVQNGEIHTHGVGAPDLGLGAHRSAVIINDLADRVVYPVRERNVFQQFGAE
jgi:lysine N6-hydroxylase